MNSLNQCFSNYGPWTTSAPRGLPLWSFKKCRRKIQIQINCLSHFSRKSQSSEMTHGNRLSPFLQILTFMKLITLLICRLLSLLSATNKRFKALRTWYFRSKFGAAPITQPGTYRIHNRGPKYWTFSCIYDILNSFADTQSAHWNGHVLSVVHQ